MLLPLTFWIPPLNSLKLHLLVIVLLSIPVSVIIWMTAIPTCMSHEHLGLSFPSVHLNDLLLLLPAIHSHLPLSLPLKSQKKAPHPLVTSSSLSRKSTLGFPCLLLWFFSPSDTGSLVTSLGQPTAVRIPPHHPTGSVFAEAAKGHLNVTSQSLLPPTYPFKTQHKHHLLQESLSRHFLCMPGTCWTTLYQWRLTTLKIWKVTEYKFGEGGDCVLLTFRSLAPCRISIKCVENCKNDCMNHQHFIYKCVITTSSEK